MIYALPQAIETLIRWGSQSVIGTHRLSAIHAIPSFSLTAVINSEDCLYLNIWSPAVVQNAPVLVYVHGGGLLIGAGAYNLPDGSNIYDGLEFAQKGIVFVSFNYRLGVFGLFYSGTEEAPGNQALWDQLMAIQWVNENIEAFGGNPKDVTLFGNSAGSWSIGIHALSPLSSRYFTKAIMSSGVSKHLQSVRHIHCSPICCTLGAVYPKLHQMDRESALNLSKSFAQNSGKCANESLFVECLRKIDYKTLLSQHLKDHFNVFSKTSFKPVYGEDQIFPRALIHAFEDNTYNTNITFLMGHTELEGYIFVLYPAHFGAKTSLRYFLRSFFKMDRTTIEDDIKNRFVPVTNQTVLDRIAEKYTDINETNRELRELNKLQRMAAIQALGDYHFTCPTVLFGVNVAKNTKANVYQFVWNFQGIHSYMINSDFATHGSDIFTLFYSPLSRKYHLPFSQKEQAMSDFFIDILVTFVKTGSVPTPSSSSFY